MANIIPEIEDELLSLYTRVGEIIFRGDISLDEVKRLRQLRSILQSALIREYEDIGDGINRINAR